jgi:nucleoside-diphosphate-sugar epimerase
MKKKYLVVGAGGFIGGHLVKRLLNLNNSVKCVDLKPLDLWFQKFENLENKTLDMQEYENCNEMTKGVDYVFNLACNMGGIGFIENNKAECMLSVLINTNLLRACVANKVRKYFFSSSACVYNTNLQNDPNILGLKEEDAYPAFPEDGYGWEKLFSERMCKNFFEDYGLETRVARFHNIYGPMGTFDGGREKAPAAICRKVIEAKLNNKDNIDVWGDGEQTRSFLYIEDCIDAVLKLFDSNFSNPINIGSDEKVTINQLISIVEKFAKKKFKKNYQLEKPQGVKGRSSNNELIKKILGWEHKYSLMQGLEKTYNWINSIYEQKKNDDYIRFTKKNLKN